MKRIVLTAASMIVLSLAAPLQAEAHQEEAASPTEAEQVEQALAGFAELFPTEPLTPEQEARLPAAERIVALVIPDGTMGEMMSRMIEDMVKPILRMSGNPSTAAVAKGIGVTPFEVDLSEEQAGEIAALFDPAWDVRQEREFAVIPEVIAEMLTTLEPGMRKAMSELYAVRFTESELAEIEGFFSTEVGGKYARESFVMASDPRMMRASMEMLPQMLGSLGDLEARVAEAMAELPTPRTYEELTAEEQARVVEATGFSDEEIRAHFSIDYDSEEAEWATEEALEKAVE